MPRNYGNFIAQALWQMLLIVLIALLLSLCVNYFRPGGLPLIGEQFSKAQSGGPKMAGGWEQTVISIDEARALFLTNGALFIDARPVEAYRSGHIKGALNLPPDSIGESLPGFMAKVPHDSVIVIYCDGNNCPLSREAALQLAARGYSHVMVLADGWSQWRAAGLPADIGP